MIGNVYGRTSFLCVCVRFPACVQLRAKASVHVYFKGIFYANLPLNFSHSPFLVYQN